ncbi:hypothetical protein L227DRAFT_298020 [Lentinus tigrinus ALCF2SS1-6]|uniref:Uncharacterized protein n=1 Tax=Lentinus tigrinus ALCF2SS1-6 TaxID=1328759 RepID=A0A5C2RX31_9APHY|nr:hypothetical protein L227DRAFT_298020 [Lentinus tigrinus ALCF2SS1-6]
MTRLSVSLIPSIVSYTSAVMYFAIRDLQLCYNIVSKHFLSITSIICASPRTIHTATIHGYSGNPQNNLAFVLHHRSLRRFCLPRFFLVHWRQRFKFKLDGGSSSELSDAIFLLGHWALEVSNLVQLWGRYSSSNPSHAPRTIRPTASESYSSRTRAVGPEYSLSAHSLPSARRGSFSALRTRC